MTLWYIITFLAIVNNLFKENSTSSGDKERYYIIS